MKMSMYKISILGLYQYSDTLFDKLTMPTVEVINPIPGQQARVYVPDKDTLVSMILEKSSDLPCLYPNFEFMQFMVGVWSKNCQYMMTTLWNTMNAQYNPIHNYDRTGTIKRNSKSSSSGNSVNSQTAFNSDSFKDLGKNVSSGSATGDETVTETVSGNIGVTSTQQMLTQQRDIAMFKWYDIVSDDFISKFCIQIY